MQHHDLLIEALENGDNVDVIYLDFAKAFDKVSHDILLRKLKTKFGIKGKLGRWIQNFLTSRSQQVLVDGRLSPIFHLVSGVPQGSVLGPVLFLIFISDIGEDLDSDVLIYVDDTKVIRKIKNIEDVINLQEDLLKLYRWGEENKMSYNGSKFVTIRHGKNTDIKEDTMYFSCNFEEIIEEQESTRDLGVIMQNNASFSIQIDKASSKARQKAGWINRSFYCKQGWFMCHMWNTLVAPHLDYCNQLWAPGEGCGLEKLEKVLKDFTAKVPEVKALNYWLRLKHLNMNSVQRRIERYRIIYVWKTIEAMVPGNGVCLAPKHNRKGHFCKIPCLKPAERIKRDISFQVAGPKLFNCLPKKLRNTTHCTLEDFKEQLDEYLTCVPDEPKIGGLMPLNFQQSNSLVYQVARREPSNIRNIG